MYLGLAVALASLTLSAGDEGLFPFVVSYDAPQNATNVSAWLAAPAGRDGFVVARDGRLATASGPVRFWATNLCFQSCFPERQQAERVAARLARLGINCVRMHHMDSRHIWGKSPNKTVIDPEQLDRLDYLIYQLKLRGVYTNLNLHVSRWLDEAEGFPHRRERPNYDKGLDNFEPQMIELQKKYARDLLTHVNPYTGTAYIDEPAIAFVEINNENSFFDEWSGGGLDRLPEPFATTYRTLWNGWLRKKYGDTAAIKKAWNAGRWPLGEELLANGDLATGKVRPWNLERDNAARAVLSVEGDGQRHLRIRVERMGNVPWNPQLTYTGLTVKKGQPYTLSFRARADAPRRLSVNCMMAHEPWENLGFHAPVEVTDQWRTYRFTFLPDADDANARISFSSLAVGTHDLAEVSFRPGGVLGLEDEQRLEDASIPPLLRQGTSLTPAARGDFADFIWETEHGYWTGMYRFLKDELKVRSLVAGTQLAWSPPHIQTALDYVDDHSYWQHPHFPGRPWDSNNWTVNNVAMVSKPGGTLSRLACRRPLGKPYTVSEYNHPAPLQYAAEGFPMIAAFAAMQGWDGVYSFAYCHNDRFEPQKIESFFDIKSDPAKIAHMPACAAMFLRGDVARARQTLAAPMPAEAERQRLRETLSVRAIDTEAFGVPRLASLEHAIGLDLAATRGGLRPPQDKAAAPSSDDADARRYVADSGQIVWDATQPGKARFTVDCPRAKLFTGFHAADEVSLGDVGLRIGPTRLGWATVSLVCLDGAGFDRSGRILLVATGEVKNTGAELRRLGGDLVTLGNRWGEPPILCEGVPVEVVLPVAAARATLYPLDESGARREGVALVDRGGKAVAAVGPQHRTIWYEIELK